MNVKREWRKEGEELESKRKGRQGEKEKDGGAKTDSNDEVTAMDVLLNNYWPLKKTSM